MTQKAFSNLLKAAIILAFLCCVFVYSVYVPLISMEAKTAYPELAGIWLPALIFVELTAAPILAAFVLAWLIARDIGRDQSFSRANAGRMKAISILALADVVYFFIGILVFSYGYGAGSGPMFVLVMLVCSAGMILSVCAGALSHLIFKAAKMREENDLTV